MDIQELIEKYKAEWVKAKAASTFVTKGGYTKTNAEQLGRQGAFAQMINDLVELQILLNKKSSSDTPPQLNKGCVSRSVYDIVYSSIGKDYVVKVEGTDMKDALFNFHRGYHSVDKVYSITAAE